MYFDDHDPPYVHVFKAGGQAKTELGRSEVLSSLSLVQSRSMKDAKAAISIVTDYQAYLLEKGEEYQG